MPARSVPFRYVRTLGLGLAALGLSTARGAAADAPEEFFEKKIRPLLAENCLKCHGEEKQKGGLRLDSRAAALEGGYSPDLPLLIDAFLTAWSASPGK
eukprot:gene44164-54895_t